MSLSPGTRLGPYEILSPLGAGGMGEVYRARDTRLGRDVAVKVLPPGLTDSEQARQRFEREARTISQLSHSHICALYDVGREGDTEYLVMELLEGQTLADRLAKGPLPLDQALRLGAEVADALEKAHRGGVVHRDLKPGNIMLTSSGVKVLDFGLAKGLDSFASGPVTTLPTEAPLTEAGTVLGTVQYMAPEQLEGKNADARTDVYALGLVLYEMATGRTAFAVGTRASLISSILRDDPPPVSKDQPLSPRAFDRVVATCLAKEPEDRWQTARDVALQLEGIRQDRSAPAPAVAAPGPRLSTLLPWMVAAAAVVLAAWGLTRGGTRAAPTPIHTLLLPPPDTGFNYGANSAPAVIAPDQKRLVFGTRDADGAIRLWIQDLDATEAYPVPGTEGALFPFWSPDGRFIAFFARGTLKVIEASRSPGPARTLAADILEARGGTWSQDGTILYSPGNVAVIMRVPAAGGKPEPVTRMEGAEKSHRWPRFLPGGRRFLYEVRQPSPGAGAAALASRLTYLASLDGKEKRLVLSDVTSAAYVPPGHLLFGRANNLMAVACDPKTLELKGEPVVLASHIQGFTAPGAPFFSVSERLLVYSQNAGARTTRMVWFDRSGKELGTVGEAGEYLSLGMAADGRTVVASRAEEPLPPDLWLFDTGVGRGIRLTRDNVPQLAPVVAPGGQRIFFSSFSRGPWDIWTTTPKGMPDLKPFLESDTPKAAKDISPDGRFLLYREFNVGTLGDLKVAALEGDPAPRTFVATADDETAGDFSPDGRSVAYVSDESGRPEVYVASFPEPTHRLRVTSEGGSQPRWGRDGKELFYIRAGHLVAVPVTGAGDELAFGQGKTLFALPLFVYVDPGFDVATRYDVAPDGRFLALVRTREEGPEPLTVVQNWAEALKKEP